MGGSLFFRSVCGRRPARGRCSPQAVLERSFSKINTIAISILTRYAHFVRASDWFRANGTKDDTVFIKLNCEGCECDIIEDVFESGEYKKVDFRPRDTRCAQDTVVTPSSIRNQKSPAESNFANHLFTDGI